MEVSRNRAMEYDTDEPNLEVLWRVVMGFYDRRTNLRVPGMMETLADLAKKQKDLSIWIKVAAVALIIVAAKSIGVPTDILLKAALSAFGVHVPS